MSELEDKVLEIEARLEELKRQPKDAWDVLQIIGALLVPLAIAFAGWEYSRAMKEAEVTSAATIANLQLEFAEQKERFDQKISETNSRVGQAELVASFLEALLSPDPKTQKLAMEAVLIALPSEGLRLVKVLEDVESNAAVKAAAADSISNFRSKLLRDFFSTDAQLRKTSFSQLLEAYGNDATIVGELLELAQARNGNRDAMVNTLALLALLPTDLLAPHVGDIGSLANAVRGNGPVTRDRLRDLYQVVPCPGVEETVRDSYLLEQNRFIGFDNDKLALLAYQVSATEVAFGVSLTAGGLVIDKFTLASGGQASVFFNGVVYLVNLNTIRSQPVTGDLQANVSIAMQACI